MKTERDSLFFASGSVAQSPLSPHRFHVAIIMDGNGRWATARGKPREYGHRRGVPAVRRTVRAAPDAGIDILTLYAFSSDNWRRPVREVRTLMSLFRRYLRSEVEELRSNGVRLQVIGRRDRLSESVVRAVQDAEAATAGGTRLLLRLAVDYSARHALLEAARRCTDPESLDHEGFARMMQEAIHGGADGTEDVDLLIRTGGERRLSDFLLWECAYAELVFTSRMWPDFTADDLHAAVAEFRGRNRRFGALAAVG